MGARREKNTAKQGILASRSICTSQQWARKPDGQLLLFACTYLSSEENHFASWCLDTAKAFQSRVSHRSLKRLSFPKPDKSPQVTASLTSCCRLDKIFRLWPDQSSIQTDCDILRFGCHASALAFLVLYHRSYSCLTYGPPIFQDLVCTYCFPRSVSPIICVFLIPVTGTYNLS